MPDREAHDALAVAPANALARLLEIALELSSERELDGILKIATSGVCSAVGCERASLFVYDEHRHELYTRVVTALEIAEIRHPLDRGIVGWVAKYRQLLSVPVPADDSRWDSSVDRRTGFRTRNILSAPVLATDGRLLGVLQLLNKSTGFGPLDEQLVQAFAAHVAVALERPRLEEAARKAWELQQSLEMGHRIQATFLPTKLPQIAGYEVAAWWQPAEFVSGDYYDWLPLADGRWGFAVGDVSGHGLPAALLMATVRAMAHVLSRMATDVHSFVETLRASIMPDLKDGRFVTCCYLVLDPIRHHISWANAGHAPVFRYCSQSGKCFRLGPTTLPLGFPDVPSWSAVSDVGIAPGDIILLGTDGIIEVRDADDRMYGADRLEHLVQAHAYASAADLVSAVSADVTQFRGRESPLDDATVVVIRRSA